MNNLTISPVTNTNLNYSVTCPSAGSYTFNSNTSLTYNFGIDCNGTGFDLHASAWGNVAAPGSSSLFHVYTSNISCSSVNGVVTLSLSPEVTYVGTVSGTPPSSVSGNTLTWNHTFPAGQYWGSNTFSTLLIETDSTAVLFDTACFSIGVTPLAGDNNPNNNVMNFCRIIGGPYDPNNKLVSANGTNADGPIAPNSVLTYTVNFQNTGTAPAINVYIMDTISSNLDMNTFEILASSHTMNPYFYNVNTVRFDFPNINLPDSTTNEPASHGWVVYRIKAKSNLADGTQIPNTAYIYFDYNAPIVTNTTISTIDIILGAAESVHEVDNSFFPNPASNCFTVKFEKEMKGTLMIFDATGRTVKSVQLSNTTNTQVNVSDLAPGLYSISIPGAELKQNRLQVIR